MMRFATSSLVILLAGPLSLLAAETTLRASQVPAAVRAEVAKRYPGAKPSGYSKEVEPGKTAYEVKLRSGKDRMEVSFSEDGKLLSEETQIAFAAVPGPVQKAFADSKYGKWKVAKVEKIVTGDDSARLTYELEVRQGRDHAEAVFDDQGKLIKDEVLGRKAY